MHINVLDCEGLDEERRLFSSNKKGSIHFQF